MVNFFIGRPIFATVLALLMLLVGGICVFVLPIAQYPEITPAQVQVTTTYTGADAQTVAETVTTPIEQQINGVKGMIYFNSDSTSNGVSTIVATFDVGYSQDIGAVDIQNRVQTAQAVLPPEVKQFGVTIKKTSTDMVCVVNLVSPDGRYDSTYLDNYAQIYVLDVLKRIPGVSDVTRFGRKYAMRIWLDPTGWPPSSSRRRRSIDGDQVREPAGRRGQDRRPAGAAGAGSSRVPDPGQGTADDASRSSRRSSSGAGTTARSSGSADVARDRARLGELRHRRLAERQAGRAPCRSTSTPTPTRSTSSARSARAWTGSPRTSRPASSTASPTTRPSTSARTSYEVEETLLEAFLLVLLVVFVFLQGVRATIIPMMAIPVSLVATFAMMAAFGFSINTLTLCGLILAIGLVVDDAIIVVENVEKYLERGERPLQAVRAAMAEITAPIVTITLVLAAVFVPVAFIPGLTGRLYNQFAMTIVFSFVFSAINSLTFSPAMSRLFLRPKHGETEVLPVPLVQPRDALARELVRLVPRLHGPPLVDDRHPVAGAAGADVCDAGRAAQGVHPDRGPGLPDRRDPDARRHGPGSDLADRRAASARSRWSMEGVSDVVLLEGFNVLNSTNQTNSATAFVILKEWSERTKPELARPALTRTAPGRDLRGGPRSRGPRAPAAADPRPEPDRRLRVHDRGPRRQGRRGPGHGHRPVPRRGAAKRPELGGLFTPFSANVPQLRFDLDRTKAQRLDVAVSDVFAVLQTNLGGYYVNDFNLYGKVWKVMVQAEGAPARPSRRHRQALRPQPARASGFASTRWAT